jgi:TolA-binding protein
MFYLLESSSLVAVPLWLAVATPLATIIVTLLGVWLNRKRRSSVRAEDAKTSAEAHSIEIRSIAELLQQVRDLRREVEEITEEARRKVDEHRKTQNFLREQLQWHEQLSIMARKAAHGAINEIQRCVWAIHLRDEALRERDAAVRGAEELLKDGGVEFTEAMLTAVEPFEQKRHDDIMRYQELPLPPPAA